MRGVPYYFTPVTVSKMFVATLTGSRKRHKERVFKYAMYLGKYRSSAEMYYIKMSTNLSSVCLKSEPFMQGVFC